MIVLDTSVWIEFFRGSEPYFSAVSELAETRQILGLECVFAELMQGARTQRERTFIRSIWESLPQADSAGGLIDAGEEAGIHRWPEKGVGIIDAYILFSARRVGARIWSLDKKLNSLLNPAEFFSI